MLAVKGTEQNRIVYVGPRASFAVTLAADSSSASQSGSDLC